LYCAASKNVCLSDRYDEDPAQSTWCKGINLVVNMITAASLVPCTTCTLRLGLSVMSLHLRHVHVQVYLQLVCFALPPFSCNMCGPLLQLILNIGLHGPTIFGRPVAIVEKLSPACV